jgi:UDP-N-acetyl-D-mannosaminuronate dehydrogenase
MDFKISIIGLGFVGSSMYKSFELKEVNVIGYDKYKNGGIGSLEECYSSDIMFLCLPTQYDSKLCQYDKSNIYNTCDKLQEVNYKGLIVIKCTVEPETTDNLSKKYPSNQKRQIICQKNILLCILFIILNF